MFTSSAARRLTTFRPCVGARFITLFTPSFIAAARGADSVKRPRAIGGQGTRYVLCAMRRG